MLTNILYIILAILIITTLYVVVRTLIFSWRQRGVAPVEGMPIDNDKVAEHLAASIRCQTAPLDDKGTPDPEAFKQLHRMLEETYPLVHQKLKREVINGYSLLYTWQGSRADLEPVMLMAHQDVVSADPTCVDSSTVRRPHRGRIHLGSRHSGHQEPVDRHHGRGRGAAPAGIPPGAHHPVRARARRRDRRSERLQDNGAAAQGVAAFAWRASSTKGAESAQGWQPECGARSG